jgi:hypothetical protein
MLAGLLIDMVSRAVSRYRPLGRPSPPCCGMWLPASAPMGMAASKCPDGPAVQWCHTRSARGRPWVQSPACPCMTACVDTSSSETCYLRPCLVLRAGGIAPPAPPCRLACARLSCAVLWRAVWLCGVVLHCVGFCFAVLCCAVLCCVMLCYAVLCHAVVCGAMLCCIALCCCLLRRVVRRLPAVLGLPRWVGGAARRVALAALLLLLLLLVLLLLLPLVLLALLMMPFLLAVVALLALLLLGRSACIVVPGRAVIWALSRWCSHMKCDAASTA